MKVEMFRAKRLGIGCLIAASTCVAVSQARGGETLQQPELGQRRVPVLQRGVLQFKDLDRNGKIDIYEDWRLDPVVRARDLVARLTLEEKAGLMMHGTAPASGNEVGVGSRYDLARARTMIVGDHVLAFITRLAGQPTVLAEENNKLQELAEQGPHGIPATVSTDPRHSAGAVLGASTAAGGFTHWPEAAGLAAARDPALTREFATIARREYRAVGIQQALSPQVDLVTEPRWPRIVATFGEDPRLASKLGEAYVVGMQGGDKGVTPHGVLAVVKHWVGYGAAKDGWDSHNAYGRFATFQGASLQTHIAPFKGALAAHVAGVMPTYSILLGGKIGGHTVEPVAAGYSSFLLKDLLRGRYAFKGVVLSDWLITEDCSASCINGATPPAKPVLGGMPWGVEDLTRTERFAKAVAAGIDQFGGVSDTSALLDAVKRGLVSEQQLDRSVTRILIDKFRLGMFEQPYVDPARAARVITAPASRAAAANAQRRSLVLLRNASSTLPLHVDAKVFLYGVDVAVARSKGLQVVDSPAAADLAIVRVGAPFEKLHPNFFFGSRQHEGSLRYKDGDADYEAIKAARGAKRVIVAMYMDRPAILDNVVDKADAVIAHFGIDDGVLLDAISDGRPFTGKLPFELPLNESVVSAQRSDIPSDSQNKLFNYGFGLTR